MGFGAEFVGVEFEGKVGKVGNEGTCGSEGIELLDVVGTEGNEGKLLLPVELALLEFEFSSEFP